MSGLRRLLIPALLVLPILGLGIGWASTEAGSRQGVEWDVPIGGYDPRDLLRGHYVQFRYDWPVQATDDEMRFAISGQSICLTGTAPVITSARWIYGDEDAKDCDEVVIANPWADEGADGINSDRLYVPQERGGDYERKLADPALQGIVRIRVNDSGIVTPVSLSFRPRPAEATEADE
ncbi:MAG: GDYXXLXY domain-containing protein [Blastomonas sp.]